MTDDIDQTDRHWDAAFAEGLIGKTLLMNLTFLDDDGGVQERQQFFGVVIDATQAEGVVLDLMGEHDGDTYTLPPQTSAIQAAEAGVTTLDGDKPDFVANWIIHGLPDVPDAANDDD
uniref:hypothetical protein n=1 Tax=uncultured Caulobacter sp. TaxID=158749 RepID=UPI0025F705E4|nr:hypothetical protein [uncultured Caulobacter sp.]